MTSHRRVVIRRRSTFIILLIARSGFCGVSCLLSSSSAKISSFWRPSSSTSFLWQIPYRRSRWCGMSKRWECDPVEEDEESYFCFPSKMAPSKKINIDNDNGMADQSRRRMVCSVTTAILSSGSVLLSGNMAKAEEDALVEDGRIVLSTSTGNFPVKYANSPPPPSKRQQQQQQQQNIKESSLPLCVDPDERRVAIFERVAPSVVYIDTFFEQRDVFTTNVMDVPMGTGSGFVWDDKGHIVTNYHVVRNAKAAQVAILSKVFSDELPSKSNPRSNSKYSTSTTSPSVAKPYSSSVRPGGVDPTKTDLTRKVYKARIVGVDPGKDIAVLKIDAPVFDLYPMDIGTSTGLRVGQQALAIGNPFGLDHTLTSGIISGIGREIKSPSGRPISNVIQTDAAINPGNSGGPVLDSQGRLIGMSTAIYSPSGASAGIGFAIPIDSVQYIVDTLIRDGRVVRPVLGISYLESRQARALGIGRGVLVLDVPVNSAAYKAGMRGTRRTESGLIEIGDIIVAVEDNVVNTEADLFQALEKFRPGDRVRVKVNRPDLVDTQPLSSSSTYEKLMKLQLKEKILTIALAASTTLSPRGGLVFE